MFKVSVGSYVLQDTLKFGVLCLAGYTKVKRKGDVVCIPMTAYGAVDV
jgi:hypothetical protein